MGPRGNGPTPDPASIDRSASLLSDSNLRAIAAAPPPRLRRASGCLAAGTVVDGTFRIESELGAGAMGVVYAATDLSLDRRVALKVHAAADDDVRASRPWREAKAMARLSHPNVIAVYEVGEHEGRVYIAMELVGGGTLRDWLDQPRTWREIVAVFVQAAQGLAGAHAVGLVHRDFKPTNVLIGTDGRVRVADFGLARAAIDLSATIPAGAADSSPSLEEPLTATGALVGTPAYMAPEQLEQRPADHRSDQFAFCVALHEALYGVRPFDAGSLPELVEAATRGHVRPPPSDRDVPPWLRAIVLRGLEPHPERRFADMGELLRALADDPSRRRTIVLAAAGGGTVVIALLGTIAWLALRDPAAIDCTDGAALLGGAWDETRRAAVKDGLLATELPYAEETWTRVETGLDAYARSWTDAAMRACESGTTEPPPALHEARALCLEKRRQELVALVDVLADAHPSTVERAVQAVTVLPSVTPCDDLDYLAANVKPPADPLLAGRVELVQRQLDRALALHRAGSIAQGQDEADAALEVAQALDHPALLAEALYAVGMLSDANGDYERAESRLRDAYTEAVASGHDEVATDAAAHLVYLVGHRLARHDEGLEWGVHALAEARRIGFTDGREATVLNNLGAVYQVRGEYDEALEHYRRALSLREEVFGPDHLEVARVLSNLGTVHRLRGEFDEAVEHYRRAIAIREASVGPHHPALASSLAGLGAALFERGDHDEAIAATKRSIAIREAALGPEHADLASPLSNLGVFLERRGMHDEALRYHERALAIEERTLGPDHPNAAISVENIGNVHFARGDFAAAEAAYRRVLEVRERVLGPDHPHVAASLANLGLTLSERGALDEALAIQMRALSIAEKTAGPNDRGIAGAEEDIGNVLFLQHRFAEALAHHRRALEIREAGLGPRHPDAADSHTNLGNALESLGEYEQALEHHRRALEIVNEALGTDHPRVSLAEYNIGQTLALMGELEEAIACFERALAQRERDDTPPADRADVRFALAKELWALDRDRGRAIALAEQAHDEYGPELAQFQAEVQAWLTDHRAR